jgi:hypothetical protein
MVGTPLIWGLPPLRLSASPFEAASGVIPEHWRKRGRALTQSRGAVSTRSVETTLHPPGRIDSRPEHTIAALGSVEVRIAAADEVPSVAAALADAFINDPVFRSFGRAVCGGGRGCERCLRSRWSSTCWRTGDPCERRPRTTVGRPSCPLAPGRCRSRRPGRRRSSGCGRLGGDCRVHESAPRDGGATPT